MTMVKVSTIEDQVCVVLPPQLVAKLDAMPGKNLATRSTANGVELLKPMSEADLQMQLAEEIMEEDKEVLRQLAE